MPVRHETAAVDHQLVLKVLGNLIGYGGHRPFLSLGRQAGTGITYGNRQSGSRVAYLRRKAEGADVPVNRKPATTAPLSFFQYSAPSASSTS